MYYFFRKPQNLDSAKIRNKKNCQNYHRVGLGNSLPTIHYLYPPADEETSTASGIKEKQFILGDIRSPSPVLIHSKRTCYFGDDFGSFWPIQSIFMVGKPLRDVGTPS